MADRIVLHKEGYNPLTIRKREPKYYGDTDFDGYEMLMHTDHYGGERWEKLPQSDEVIEAQIEELKDAKFTKEVVQKR